MTSKQIDRIPPSSRPAKKIADPGGLHLGDGLIRDEFPPLHRPGKKIADRGTLRLGDGWIADEFSR